MTDTYEFSETKEIVESIINEAEKLYGKKGENNQDAAVGFFIDKIVVYYGGKPVTDPELVYNLERVTKEAIRYFELKRDIRWQNIKGRIPKLHKEDHSEEKLGKKWWQFWK